jgi:hypothetical protein
VANRLADYFRDDDAGGGLPPPQPPPAVNTAPAHPGATFVYANLDNFQPFRPRAPGRDPERQQPGAGLLRPVPGCSECRLLTRSAGQL